jgi:GNAT superfamily N-acetyltransferase
MDFETVNLNDLQNRYFAQAWKLYENSFPKEERRTFNEQETVSKDEKYKALGIIKDNELLAILFFWIFDKNVFIEHFAVNSAFRGQSFGSKILKSFLSKYENVVLEIELIKDEICERRLNFYKKFDFIVNEYKHFQIPFRKDSKELELLLLSYKKPLSKEQYKSLYIQMKNSLTVK